MADLTFKAAGDAQLGHVTAPEGTDALPVLRSPYTGTGKDGYVLWSDLEALFANHVAYSPTNQPFRPGIGSYVGNMNHGTLTTSAGVAGYKEIFPFIPGFSFNCLEVGISVSTAVASAEAKVILYAADSNGRPTTFIQQSAAIDCSSTGTKTTAFDQDFVVGTRYWLGVWHSSTATLRAANTSSNIAIAWTNSATPTAVRNLRVTETYGGTASDWTYATSQHISNRSMPFVLLRVDD